MRALALNCTLKRSPETSNTGALAEVVLEALAQHGVETEMLRVVDHVVEPGVVSEALSEAGPAREAPRRRSRRSRAR